MNRNVRIVLALIALAVVVEGFRLATQAGLPAEAGFIQNDGYAMSGGLLILLGGLILGYLLAKQTRQKGQK